MQWFSCKFAWKPCINKFMLELQIKHIIYRAVADNPEISKKKLAWVLATILGEEEIKIDKLIEGMMNNQPELVRCLNYFKVPENRTRKGVPVILLRINPVTQDLVNSIFVAHQQVHNYEVQSLKLGGTKDGSNALKKIGVVSSIPDSSGR